VLEGGELEMLVLEAAVFEAAVFEVAGAGGVAVDTPTLVVAGVLGSIGAVVVGPAVRGPAVRGPDGD
jgi:hypothetical protein